VKLSAVKSFVKEKNLLSRTGEWVSVVFPVTFLIVSVPILFAACPPGTKTEVDVGVRINTETCKEDRTVQLGESVVLNCPALGAEGKVRVLFPRAEWYSIKARAAGTLDAGPGK